MMLKLKRIVESAFPTVTDLANLLEEFCGVRYDEKDLSSKYGVLVHDPLHPEYGVIIKVYNLHVYYSYYKLGNIGKLVPRVAESMDDYYSSEREKERVARKLLLKEILNIRGYTGRIENHVQTNNKEIFFSELRRIMDMVRREIDDLVDQYTDVVIMYWDDLHQDLDREEEDI